MKTRYHLAQCGVNISEAIRHYGSEEAYFKLLSVLSNDSNIKKAEEYINSKDRDNALTSLSELALSFSLLFCVDSKCRIDGIMTSVLEEDWQSAKEAYSDFIKEFEMLIEAIRALD